MPSDLILTAGPFFGQIGPDELRKLAVEMDKRGCSWKRAHQHKSWIVMEGWKVRPDEQGELPTGEFLDALIAGEASQ